MERRCNQVIDCRDESGEDRCKVIILKSNFNKRIPPIYDKTDQKEATTLGADWEWSMSCPRVTVTREGDFTRSGFEEVDEVEIFEGAENRLTMNQTYTLEFQCKYELQRYPFDTQVTDSL